MLSPQRVRGRSPRAANLEGRASHRHAQDFPNMFTCLKFPYWNTKTAYNGLEVNPSRCSHRQVYAVQRACAVPGAWRHRLEDGFRWSPAPSTPSSKSGQGLLKAAHSGLNGMLFDTLLHKRCSIMNVCAVERKHKSCAAAAALAASLLP